MTDDQLPEHVRVNRAHWDEDAANWVAGGERNWRSEPTWGMWDVAAAGFLPDDMTGLDAIELGCGTAYVSAWMARRGANVVGIDNSERQLATARRLAAEHGVDLTLIHGNAETVPYPDGSFDFAISEYGAAIWCDPYVWIPGGLSPAAGRRHAGLPRHVDAGHAVLPGRRIAADHHPSRARLLHDPPPRLAQRRRRAGRHRVQPAAVGLVPAVPRRPGSRSSSSSRSRLPSRPPEAAAEVNFFVTAEWAHRYPSEQAWVLRKLMTGGRRRLDFSARQARRSPDLPLEGRHGRRSRGSGRERQQQR